MDDLLQSLLNYSIVGSAKLEREPADFWQLVDQAIESLSHEIQKAGVAIKVSGNFPSLHCVPAQMHAVLVNLMMNGIKYNSSAEKVIEIGFQDGDEPTFFVKDNGIGIPPEQHANVFTIFRRLHGKGEFGGGTGAGLTIVKKTVESHGGTIWIESSHAGSTFFFTLPQQKRQIEKAATSN